MESGSREAGEGQEAAREQVGDGQQCSGGLQGGRHELREGVAQGTPQEPVAAVGDAGHHVVRKLEPDQSQRPVLLQQQRRHRPRRHPAHIDNHTAHYYCPQPFCTGTMQWSCR